MNVTSTEETKGGVQLVQPIPQANTEFRAMDHLARCWGNCRVVIVALGTTYWRVDVQW
jgi:hypothetical protein